MPKADLQSGDRGYYAECPFIGTAPTTTSTLADLSESGAPRPEMRTLKIGEKALVDGAD
jgi:hypothetical protein